MPRPASCGPSKEGESSDTGVEVKSQPSSPPTCRRGVAERPRRENQRQRAVSTWEELRQKQRERQRRDSTGERLKKHNDTRDSVSGGKKEKEVENSYVQQKVVFMPSKVREELLYVNFRAV